MCDKGDDEKMGMNQKYAHLKSKLDLITKDAPLRTGIDKMIELDPNNNEHREWFEKDLYKGE